MPFNQLWGVGRELQVAAVPNNAVINVDQNWGNPPSGLVNSTAITTPIKIFAVSVNVRPHNTNGVQGDAVRPQLRVFINDRLIVSYTLPPVAGDSSEWNVQDIIPYDLELWGSGNVLRDELEAVSVGGNGYGAYIKIVAYGISI